MHFRIAPFFISFHAERHGRENYIPMPPAAPVAEVPVPVPVVVPPCEEDEEFVCTSSFSMVRAAFLTEAFREPKRQERPMPQRPRWCIVKALELRKSAVSVTLRNVRLGLKILKSWS